MADTLTTSPPTRTSGSDRPPRSGTTSATSVILKVVALGTVIGCAAALTPTLVGQERWGFLFVVWAVAAILVATYATGRGVPAKYLVPGTLFLVLFVVYPIVSTAQLSFTNFGDGTRTDKEDTIAQIVGSSVQPTADSPRYNPAGRDGGLGGHRAVRLLPRRPRHR